MNITVESPLQLVSELCKLEYQRSCFTVLVHSEVVIELLHISVSHRFASEKDASDSIMVLSSSMLA